MSRRKTQKVEEVIPLLGGNMVLCLDEAEVIALFNGCDDRHKELVVEILANHGFDEWARAYLGMGWAGKTH